MNTIKADLRECPQSGNVFCLYSQRSHPQPLWKERTFSSLFLMFTVICKSLRPDMIFRPFHAMMSDYLISCFYCIIQFGFKKSIRNERGHFGQCVREKTTIQKHTKTDKPTNKQQQKPQTNKQKTNKLLDVTTFQIVLYYAFGEINLHNLVWMPKDQFCKIYFKNKVWSETFANDCILPPKFSEETAQANHGPRTHVCLHLTRVLIEQHFVWHLTGGSEGRFWRDYFTDLHQEIHLMGWCLGEMKHNL